MKTPAWRRYLTFWRTNISVDVDDELQFHADMRVEEFVARGMSEDDARRAVATRLGDLASAKSECVELGQVRATHARRANFFDGLRADARYAMRSLARTPGWTAVALLTIALGVGATTTVFSVADALLLRTFPFENTTRVYLARRQFEIRGDVVPVALPFGIARVWRERAQTIEAASRAGGGGSAEWGTGADVVTVTTGSMDPDFLAFAGVHPIVGRVREANELSEDGPAAVLLSEQFWRRQYGAATDVIGKTVALRGRPSIVVAVTPASFTIPDFRAKRADVYILTPPSAAATGAVFVRLKPGVSPAAATQELEAIMQRAQLPDVRPVPMPMPLHLTRPQDWLAIRQPLTMLTVAVGLLLLVACTNVVHLLLARGASRQRELAVRYALGAGRLRLLRQLVTESVVLAGVGGLLAVGVGALGLRVLASLRPAAMNALTYISIDTRVVTIASILAVLCGLAIGLLTALRSAHRDLGVSLRVGAASTARAGRRLRSSLVVGEIALSATLLVGALLLIHAVYDLQRTKLGFDVTGLYSLRFPVSRGMQPPARDAYASTVIDRVRAIPGVSSAVATEAPWPRGFVAIAAFETPEGPEVTPESASGSMATNTVTPDYFSVLGIPLIAGHMFDAGSAQRNEVIISTALAHQVWPNADPIGRRFRNAVSKSRGVIEPWQTVIGVVPDVIRDLTNSDANPGLYRPKNQAPGANPPFSNDVALVVRVRDEDAAARLERFTKSAQLGTAAVTMTNLRSLLDETMAEPRFTMRILAGFAMLGVVLAAIGLFGVISYGVGQRTREIGVRMALGATRRSIARLVVGDGVRLAVVGTVLGLAGAAAGTRLIQSLLFGVSRFDAFAFGFGAVLLLVISTIACVIPTLRATHIDPAVAVRVD
jgi:predicted permease